MWPLAGFAFGAVVGAMGVAWRGAQIAEHARPAAKAALKAMLAAAHEAHIRQVEVVEAAEDLYAEAEAEAAAERRASATAAASEEAAAKAVNESDLREPRRQLCLQCVCRPMQQHHQVSTHRRAHVYYGSK